MTLQTLHPQILRRQWETIRFWAPKSEPDPPGLFSASGVQLECASLHLHRLHSVSRMMGRVLKGEASRAKISGEFIPGTCLNLQFTRFRYSWRFLSPTNGGLNPKDVKISDFIVAQIWSHTESSFDLPWFGLRNSISEIINDVVFSERDFL